MNLSAAGEVFCAKHGSLTESVGHLQQTSVSLHMFIFISTQTALLKALLASKAFDLVEQLIVNIIFRPLTKELSPVWGKQGAIKQETARETERLIVSTEIKVPKLKTTLFFMRPCKNKEIDFSWKWVCKQMLCLFLDKLCVLGSSKPWQKTSRELNFGSSSRRFKQYAGSQPRLQKQNSLQDQSLIALPSKNTKECYCLSQSQANLLASLSKHEIIGFAQKLA